MFRICITLFHTFISVREDLLRPEKLISGEGIVLNRIYAREEYHFLIRSEFAAFYRMDGRDNLDN